MATENERWEGYRISRRGVLGATGAGAAALALGPGRGPAQTPKASPVTGSPSASPTPATPEATPAVVAPRPPALHVGVGAHFGLNRGDVEGGLEAMTWAGVTSLRDEIHWDEVERERGVLAMPAGKDDFVRAAVAAGIEPVLILCYANPLYDDYRRPTSDEAIDAFARYAEFMVEHFRGTVRTFEIWNEWEIGIGGGNIEGEGSPDDYMRLVNAVYPRVKAVAPEVTVVAGAMTNAAIYNGYLDRLLELDVLRSCDILSVHPYLFGQQPLANRRPEVWWNAMRELQAKLRLANGGAEFPIYATEIGWPTQLDEAGASQELAAAYCARLYLLASTLPYVRGVWWYDFQDDFWSFDDREGNFGLVRPDLTPKEAYHAFAAVSELVAGGAYQDRLETADPEIWLLRFRSPDGPARRLGPDVLALWSAHPDDDWSMVLRNGQPDRVGPVSLEQAGRPPITRAWGRREWYDAESEDEAGPPPIPDELEVTLRRLPVLLRGDLDQVVPTRLVAREFPEATRLAGT